MVSTCLNASHASRSDAFNFLINASSALSHETHGGVGYDAVSNDVYVRSLMNQ